MTIAAPAPPHRRRLLVALAAGIGATLVACGGGAGTARTLAVSEAELTRRIGERFPLERRYLDLLDVRLDAPRLRLLPDVNRIAVDVAVSIADRLFGRSIDGTVAFDGVLRYDDADPAVRLHEVRVTQLRFDRVPAAWQADVDRLGGVLAAQVLEGVALHRFKPDDVDRARRLGLRPGRITVTSAGIEVELLPGAPL